MKVPEDLRKRLVDEIRFVAEKIRVEKDPRTKVYYFSGIYGEMIRVLNLNYDPHLLFAHNVINSSYQTMRARADAVVLGRDLVITFPDGFFDRLCSLVEDLASNIEKQADLYETLQKISCLSYITTGNGYYLFQKGTLEI